MSSVLIRGGGDLASGVAACLYWEQHKVLITELNKPATVRRKVSFSEAIYDGKTMVEEIKGSHAKSSVKGATSIFRSRKIQRAGEEVFRYAFCWIRS